MKKTIKVSPFYAAFETTKEAGIIGTFTVEAEVKAGCEEGILEDIFRKTQNLTEDGWLNEAVEEGNFVPVEEKVKVIRGHRSMRSMSMNDFVIIDFNENDRGYFFVDFSGFKELSKFQFERDVKKFTEHRG